MKITVPLEGNFEESDFDNLENLLAYVSNDVSETRLDRSAKLIELVAADSADRPSIEEKLTRLIAKARPLRPVKGTPLLLDLREQQVPCSEDIFSLLIAKRDIIEYLPGVYSLHGKFQRMFSRLDEHVRSLAADLGAEEVIYPVTIGISTLRQSNFFSHYPQFANFISLLEPDIDKISKAAKNISKGDDLDFLDSLQKPFGMCRSAGCVHSYPSYQGQTFDPDQQVTITMFGRMFRNEGTATAGLERLNEYSMREIIFMGSADFVRAGLSRCVNWCRDYLVNFGLRGVIQAANDPFFADNLAALQLFQRSEQSKLECRMISPFTGNSVSIASINYHGEHFSKSYSIKFGSGDFIQTGCFGVGYERLVFLTLSQFGYDESKWPAELREFYFPKI